LQNLIIDRTQLDTLSAGDLDVRTSIGLSYEGIGADERRMLRMLALLRVPDFTAWLAGAMLGRPQQVAEEIIERLVEARLLNFAGIDGTGTTRYRFHELLRLFFAERAVEEDSWTERRAALNSAFQAWLTLANKAESALHHRFSEIAGNTMVGSRLDPVTRSPGTGSSDRVV